MASSANVVSAKIRAMYGRRLRPEDFSALLQSHSIADLAGYLKNHTVYGDALTDIHEATLHRGHLETVLRRFRFENLVSLTRYEDMVNMPLSDFFIRLGEIQQLMSFLRLLGAGRPQEYFYDLPYYFNHHSRLDLMRLAEIRSYDQLLPLLADTRYERLLRPLPPDSTGQLRIPEIENVLYADWYESFFEHITRHTHGEEQRQLNELLSQQLNVRNVLRIYRLKMYYHMSAPDIRLHLLTPHRGMSAKALNRLLDAPAEQVMALFQNSPEGRYIPSERFEDLAQIQHHVIAYRSRHFLHYSVHPSVVLLSYMFVSEAEVDDIINIIEGIRYGLPPEQIRRLLTVSDS